MGTVVVYHFDMKPAKAPGTIRSKRPGTREAIEAMGFTPLMETAQVVERTTDTPARDVRVDERARRSQHDQVLE